MKKAIVLLSGGLDSATCLAIAQEQGYSLYALSFLYGQKHDVEVEAAKKVVMDYDVKEHRFLTLPIAELGGSSLTDQAIAVQDYQGEIADKIPNTYVPARNTIFLAFALAWGEVIGVYDIFFGANHVDYSKYPDCRPDYFDAYATLAQLATRAGVEGQPYQIHVPLLHMSKADIIREGTRLGVDYGKTISCYRADEHGRSCGKCDSCIYRKKGFSEANTTDPTLYR